MNIKKILAIFMLLSLCINSFGMNVYAMGNSENQSDAVDSSIVMNKVSKAHAENADSFRYHNGIPIEQKKNEASLLSMAPSEAKSHGIDVSHHQGVIDWSQTKDYVDFVIIRCGYGGNITSQDDKQFYNNITACERYGIPYGIFLFSYAENVQEAVDEAEHTIRLLRGHTPQLPVFYDLEDENTTGNCSNDTILAMTRAYCNAIQNAGYRAGVYASTSWWNTRLTSDAYGNWERWVAQWNTTATYAKDFNYWQYSSKGSVPGISSNVDMDYSRLSFNNTNTQSLDVNLTVDGTAYNSGTDFVTFDVSVGGNLVADDVKDFYNTSIAAGSSYVVNDIKVSGCYKLSGNTSYSGNVNTTTTVTIPIVTAHKGYNASVTKQATCTAAGIKTYTCSCGDSYTEEIPATGHSYQTRQVDPTCTEAGKIVYSCKNCGNQYEEAAASWSEWSDTRPPADIPDDKMESATFYRYQNVTTSWERMDSGSLNFASFTDDGRLSWPAGFSTGSSLYATYNRAPVTASETTSRKVTVTNRRIGWIYWHWCRGANIGTPGNRLISDEWTSEFSAFHAFYSNTDYPVSSGMDVRQISRADVCTDTYWWWDKRVPVYENAYVTYSKKTTTGGWSEWSQTRPAEAEGREIQSKTMWRYRTENQDLAPKGHKYDGGRVTKEPTYTEEGIKTFTCTVCGDHYTEAIEKLTREDHILASGSCGNALSWSFYETGKLIINGNGSMKSYEYTKEVPWYAYIDQITEVEFNGNVTTIGDYAFYGLKNLRSITIPESINIIGEYAFKNCIGLEEVDMPDHLSKLGESAFYGCSKLKSIVIPEGLYTVWAYTFKNCSALSSVSFPSTLIKIDEAAFYACSSLTEVVIPDNISIVGAYAFKNCTKLNKLTLSDSLTEIREAAFYANNLSTLTVPEGINKIGPYAFKNCTHLVSIRFPDSLRSIEESAFYGAGVMSLNLPDGVTTIGSYAFKGCENLTRVHFPEELTKIGDSAFYYCTELEEIVLPEKLAIIEGYAFKNCSRLTEVSMPDSLTSIGESAFYACTRLETITVPVNVSKIGEYCFSQDIALKTVRFLGKAPVMGEGMFNKVIAKAYYPSGDASWTDAKKQNYGGTINWIGQ